MPRPCTTKASLLVPLPFNTIACRHWWPTSRGQHTAADVVAKAQAILSELELLTVGLCTPHYLGLFPNYIEGLWARGEHRSRPRATHRRHFPAGRLGTAQIKYGLCGN
jgi:hypothetical protein